MKSSWWWLVSAGLVGIACSTGTTSNSSSGSGSGDAADVEAYCNGLCGAEHTCDTKSDEDTCFNSCKNENAARMPHLRADLVNDIIDCIQDADCKKVLNHSAESDCNKEVSASAAPSSAATSFCEAYVSAGDKCGRDLEKATCLTASKFYNDDSLGQAEACTDKSCDAQEKCITAAFGGAISIVVDTDSGVGTDDTGTDDTGAKDSGAPATCAGIDASQSDCDQCRAASCCDQFTDYYTDPKYDAFHSCALNYPSQIASYCSSSTTYGSAYAKYNTFISCSKGSCSVCGARGE